MDHVQHLIRDKKLKPLIESQDPVLLEKRNKIYLRLCSSILSQQLSTTVAKVLYKRFLGLFGNKEPTLTAILRISAEEMRAIGFSNAKAAYVHNVCRFFKERKITDASLHEMSNEEVIQLLSQIKGVGRWTVEMILIFSLGREDVFAFDDLGLKQALIKLYDLRETDKKLLLSQMQEITKSWSPYRSYASIYLWKWKDGK